MNSPVLEMEMERLDMEIEKSRAKFYSAVLRKKRRVKRTWLEISALTNAHLLQMLPYRAMLGHVANLAEERDKVIAEIEASSEMTSTLEEPPTSNFSDNTLASSNMLGQSPQYEENSRDEAVQTEESSFSKQMPSLKDITG